MKVISYPKRVYHGQLNTNGLPHGEGIMEYSNGQQYQGGWINGQKSGFGTLKTPIQPVNKGDPSTTQFASQANTMTFTEKYWGEVYNGEFFKGVKHGLGKITLQNGNFFKGSFNMGYKSGYGIQRIGEKIYCGLWECGIMKDEFFVFSLKTGEALEVIFQKGNPVDVNRINPYTRNFFDFSYINQIGKTPSRDKMKKEKEGEGNNPEFKSHLLKKIKAIERVIHLDSVSVVPKQNHDSQKKGQNRKKSEKKFVEKKNSKEKAISFEGESQIHSKSSKLSLILFN